MTWQERHRSQIAHLSEHATALAELLGRGDVGVYLSAHPGPRHDAYQRLCAEMGIRPNPDYCHPDPYGDS